MWWVRRVVARVCMCVCVWGGVCLRDRDHVFMSKCMYARVCVCTHACIHVCVHACMCVCVCAGARLSAQVEDVVHEVRQARERAEVAARRSGATTGVYWFACVRASVLFICVPVHQHACTRMFARMYTYHMHRL